MKALDCMELLELENPIEGSDGPSMKSAGRLSSAFISDKTLFVEGNRNGRLDTFDGQKWHRGKNPEGACDFNVTTTVPLTGPLKTLIAEARKRRSEDM